MPYNVKECELYCECNTWMAAKYRLGRSNLDWIQFTVFPQSGVHPSFVVAMSPSYALSYENQDYSGV